MCARSPARLGTNRCLYREGACFAMICSNEGHNDRQNVLGLSDHAIDDCRVFTLQTVRDPD